jgi:hypothetical protein
MIFQAGFTRFQWAGEIPVNLILKVRTLQIVFLFFCQNTICLKVLIPLKGGLKRAPPRGVLDHIIDSRAITLTFGGTKQ